MIKKKKARYVFIKRYQCDFFGDIARRGFKTKWSEETQSFKIYYRNVKVIDKFIKEKWVNRIERQRYNRENKGKKKEDPRFYYRIDIINLRPRRKKRTFFGLRILKRQRMRFFSAQMTAKKYCFYLKKASHSVSVVKKFFQLFESRFDVFLYRLNFIENGFSGHQLINHKNFMINNKVVVFPSQVIGFYDMVSPVNKKYFFFMLLKKLRIMLSSLRKKLAFLKDSFLEKDKLNYKKRFRMARSRLKKLFINNIYINIPLYIEINYRIMSAIFIKLPFTNEINFPFKIKRRFRRRKYKRNKLRYLLSRKYFRRLKYSRIFHTKLRKSRVLKASSLSHKF